MTLVIVIIINIIIMMMGINRVGGAGQLEGSRGRSQSNATYHPSFQKHRHHYLYFKYTNPMTPIIRYFKHKSIIAHVIIIVILFTYNHNLLYSHINPHVRECVMLSYINIYIVFSLKYLSSSTYLLRWSYYQKYRL